MAQVARMSRFSMVPFAAAYCDECFVHAQRTPLSWTHFATTFAWQEVVTNGDHLLDGDVGKGKATLSSGVLRGFQALAAAPHW